MLFTILFFLYFTSVIVSLIIAIREVQRPILALTWIVFSLVIPVLAPMAYFLLSQRQVRRYLQVRRGHKIKTAVTLLHGDETGSAEAQPSLAGPSLAKPSLAKPSVAGQSHAGFSQEKYSEAEPSPRLNARAAQTISAWATRMLERPPLPAEVVILKNGLAKYRMLLRTLRSAKETIDMEYYIYRNDEVGQTVTKILIDKSMHGVRVRLLRDGLGSRKLPKRVLLAMANAGIEVRTVHPLSVWFSPMVTHRDHNKIVTIDQHTGLIGGMNIGDEYTGKSEDAGFWRDTHLQLTGEGTKYLQQVFDAIWDIGVPLKVKGNLNYRHKCRHKGRSTSKFANKAGARSKASLRDKFPLIEAAEELAVPTHESLVAQASSDTQEISPSQHTWVQTVDSGPDSDAEHVRDLFFLCATEARHTLDIITPYFAPDTDVVTALKTAAARGVTVRLVVPMKPDHKLIGWACRTFYTDLLLAGINVYLYKKGILHAKSIIVDSEACVIGAANYDLLSFRNNYESCEVVYSTQFAKLLQKQFAADIADSIELTPQEMESEPMWAKVRNKGARLLAPLL
ncbi:phospholipase D-like domain-containing protein [Alicyclobacillus sp. SO9]|uniref:phospholipase D-like domain-containing protein n=1 Tax=Alicyclobacillus sp. SO9 TaxID=2665646 RepID=UPI0018E7A458|nr:phospholipase D-like domain-containing protein [Alicyclobacillus sp. SO9]QQE79925.1 hypothetical protein GI364_05440 [Alicyclobacillus sp. SO9]